VPMLPAAAGHHDLRTSAAIHRGARRARAPVATTAARPRLCGLARQISRQVSPRAPASGLPSVLRPELPCAARRSARTCSPRAVTAHAAARLFQAGAANVKELTGKLQALRRLRRPRASSSRASMQRVTCPEPLIGSCSAARSTKENRADRLGDPPRFDAPLSGCAALAVFTHRRC
jgi:hypothetical protein